MKLTEIADELIEAFNSYVKSTWVKVNNKIDTYSFVVDDTQYRVVLEKRKFFRPELENKNIYDVTFYAEKDGKMTHSLLKNKDGVVGLKVISTVYNAVLLKIADIDVIMFAAKKDYDDEESYERRIDAYTSISGWISKKCNMFREVEHTGIMEIYILSKEKLDKNLINSIVKSEVIE